MDAAQRLLFHHAAFACVVTDADGVILEANQEAARLFGVGAAALAGRHLAGFMVADGDQAPDDSGAQLAYADAPLARRLVLLRPRGGDPFPAMVSALPLATLQREGAELCWTMCEIGPCIGATPASNLAEAAAPPPPRSTAAARILAALDAEIAGHRRTEAALRESEQRFRSLAAAVPDGIFRTDAEGRIAYVNQRACEILGLIPELAAGKTWLARLHPDERGRVEAAWAQAIRAGGLFRSEHRLQRHDGSTAWVYVRAAPEMAGDGTSRGYVGTVTDVTDRKQAELDLQRTSARLRRLAAHMESVREEESRKLAGEVHDSLGGALNMLKLGLAVFLEKMEPDDPARARLDALMTLSEETIRVARGITARLRPRMLDTLGLVAALRSYADEFSRMTGIHCELQLPPYIRLAPERSTAVFRIVQEALTNAARHAGANALALKVSKSGTHLVVTISDDGRGIAEGDLEKQDSYGILGMRERSQYLGGGLEIAGTPDEGTTVTLRVPFES